MTRNMPTSGPSVAIVREAAALPTDQHLPSLAGRSIVLIGMMGAGKTSIGRRLAARLGLSFRDADAEIELAAGRTIPELFDRFGEPDFRDGERRVIRRLLAGDPIVLATGGGAFMNRTTRSAVRETSVSVWLRCSLATLVRRVSSRSNRPLLAHGDPAEILAKLIDQRHPIYAEADLIVDCSDEPPDLTTSKVLNALDRWSPPRRLPVALASTEYSVVIGAGLLPRAGAHLADTLPQKRVIIVTDETVARLHLPALHAGLDQTGIKHQTIVVPPGEASKSVEAYTGLVEGLLDAAVERRIAILALGGGVVGDLAGFAAATTMRGLPLIQLPTTLLAQVDSSVGGKTGINTRHGKNLVGAFHQPKLVLADTETLATLPVRELRAGYAEIVKAGLIGDELFFQWCEAHVDAVIGGDRDAQAEAILRACAFKAAIVGEDEREERATGGRALLNLGHTFGHAIEAEYGYTGGILHGEAVAVGLGLAFRLSSRLGLCDPDDATRVSDHLERAGLPCGLNMLNRRFSASGLIANMRRDKKMRDGALHFVLARAIGDAFTSGDVPQSEVEALLWAEGAEP